MKSYNITEPVLNSILAYLETRPYKEVAQGIQTLYAFKQMGDKVEKSDKPKGSKTGDKPTTGTGRADKEA